MENEPDIVVIATGSTPIIPEIPGVQNTIVVTCIDLLLGRKKGGDRVVVIGGGLEGCETALWLAKQNKKVTIIEVLPQLMPNIYRPNRAMLIDLLADNKVDILVNTKIQEIMNNCVICAGKKSDVIKIECDTVVLAVGLKPDKKLYDSLVGESVNIYEIGDCREPRKIADAIWEACMLALNI
jgi:NAD(P)H-nitrite reductase